MDPVPLVLLVNDDPLVTRMIEALLPPSALRLLVAMDGKSGLHLALQHVPQLIICRRQMGNLTGEAFERQLHAHAETAHIPLLYTTSEDELDLLRDVYELSQQLKQQRRENHGKRPELRSALHELQGLLH